MEERADYITEGMELLRGEPSAEIEAPRIVTERREGKLVEVERDAFIKLYTSFKKELAEIDGNDLKVWIFIALSVNRFTKAAKPGIREIADKTGLATGTVQACLRRLEERGLLGIERGAGRQGNEYHPADYVSVSKFDTLQNVSNLAGNVSKNGSNVSVPLLQNAQLEELEELDSVDTLLKFEQLKQANNGADWQGREIFLPESLPLMDWYHRVTGQDCPKPKRKDWMKAATMWAANNLTVDDLQAAYDMDIKWRGVFISPNQLTDKAIALRAQKQARPVEYLRQL